MQQMQWLKPCCCAKNGATGWAGDSAAKMLGTEHKDLIRALISRTHTDRERTPETCWLARLAISEF